MKGRFKSLGLLVLSVVLGCWLVSAAQPTPEVTLETSPTLTTAQKTWFRIGYAYAEATEEDDIMELKDMLPGVPPWELLQALSEWKDDPEDQDLKGKVRPLLATYAKDQAGYLGVEAFRLGEWCSQMEDAVARFLLGVMLKNEEMFYTSALQMRILAEESQHFIDLLLGEVPAEIIQTLEQVKTNAEKIDVLGAARGRIPIDVFTKAVLALPDLVSTIKEAFGV